MSQIVAEGDVLAVEVICYLPGQISINRSHWRCASVTGTPLVLFIDVAAAWNTAVANIYKTIMAAPAKYYGVRCRRIFPVGVDRWQFVNASAGFGTAGATLLPSQSSGLLSLSGSVFGGKGSGRAYLPFPASADNDTDGVPTAGYVTRASGLVPLYTAPLVVSSSPAGGTATLNPVVSGNTGDPANRITEAVVRTAWATQRRRGSFGRLNNLPF